MLINLHIVFSGACNEKLFTLKVNVKISYGTVGLQELMNVLKGNVLLLLLLFLLLLLRTYNCIIHLIKCHDYVSLNSLIRLNTT